MMMMMMMMMTMRMTSGECHDDDDDDDDDLVRDGRRTDWGDGGRRRSPTADGTAELIEEMLGRGGRQPSAQPQRLNVGANASDDNVAQLIAGHDARDGHRRDAELCRRHGARDECMSVRVSE
jgi:hypothetical protein